MAEEENPCIECNVPGYFPTVKQLTPRMPESCTARACYKAAKLTTSASLCWVWCGGAFILTIIIVLILICLLVVLIPIILMYAIGLLVQFVRECICGAYTPDPCKSKRVENEQKEKQEEKDKDYVLRCCGDCTVSGNLVYILILVSSIPTAIVLMLVALSYLLMAGALWCCGKQGVKEPIMQSPVDLPEAPVYSQEINYDYSISPPSEYVGRIYRAILGTAKRDIKEATMQSPVWLPEVNSQSRMDCEYSTGRPSLYYVQLPSAIKTTSAEVKNGQLPRHVRL